MCTLNWYKLFTCPLFLFSVKNLLCNASESYNFFPSIGISTVFFCNCVKKWDWSWSVPMEYNMLYFLFGGWLQSDIHSMLMAMQYPLLFLCDEDGYHDDIPYERNRNNAGKKRKRVTMKKFYSYKLKVWETEGIISLYFSIFYSITVWLTILLLPFNK